jgi:hypothetical protein
MHLCFASDAMVQVSAHYAIFSDKDSGFGRCYEASAVRMLIQ